MIGKNEIPCNLDRGDHLRKVLDLLCEDLNDIENDVSQNHDVCDDVSHFRKFHLLRLKLVNFKNFKMRYSIQSNISIFPIL